MMYPSLNNMHSKSPQEHYQTPSSSSFLLPSPIYIPIEDEAVFCEFFKQHQFFSINDHNHNILAHEMPNNLNSAMRECSNKMGDDHHCDFITHVKPDINDSPRKTLSNRDRHSKINTARGPRHRRMRLSLDVAKRLFELQDLLGFDKASETVDWLLKQSKSAILDLLPDRSWSFMGVSNSTSTSGCEAVSGDDQTTTKIKAKSSSGRSKKLIRVGKCTDFQHPFAKETRIRARQRARDRTIEKQNNYRHGVGQDSTFRPFLDQAMDIDVNQLGSSSSFQESPHQSIDQHNQMSSNFQFCQGFVDDNSSVLMTGNCPPSYIFDYQYCSGLMEEHQFKDLYIMEKPWEGSNN